MKFKKLVPLILRYCLLKVNHFFILLCFFCCCFLFCSGDKGEKGLLGIPGGKGKAGMICSIYSLISGTVPNMFI